MSWKIVYANLWAAFHAAAPISSGPAAWKSGCKARLPGKMAACPTFCTPGSLEASCSRLIHSNPRYQPSFVLSNQETSAPNQRVFEAA
jgi:hypothetical protein